MLSESAVPTDALAAAQQALQARQPALAVRHLLSFLAQNPRHAPALELLGISYTQTGQKDEARRAFLLATQHEPGSASIHYNFAVFLAGLQDWDEAAEENRTALYLKPDHAGALALQQKMAEKIRFRDFTSSEGVDIKGRAVLTNSAFANVECPICGAKNHFSRRTCEKCSQLIPEMKEIIPVE